MANCLQAVIFILAFACFKADCLLLPMLEGLGLVKVLHAIEEL